MHSGMACSQAAEWAQVIRSTVVTEVGAKKVTENLVGDASGTILFKARGKEAEELTKGRSLSIQGCKVDMYHGSMRLVAQPDASFEEVGAVSAKVCCLRAPPSL